MLAGGFELIIYTLKTLAQGLIYSPCFNLIVKWKPEAVQSANKGLSENINYNQPYFSSSTEVVKKMGATEEESILVAGKKISDACRIIKIQYQKSFKVIKEAIEHSC